MVDKELLKKCTTDEERETAILFDSFGLECVDLNYKLPTQFGTDLGEIDGIFIDRKEEIIFLYDDSEKQSDTNDKISKFFTKWNNITNKYNLLNNLSLPNDYRYLIFYIHRKKEKKQESSTEPIRNLILENNFILFNDELEYYIKHSKIIGNWSKNDFYNYFKIKPKQETTIKKKAIQYYIGDTPAFVFSDKVDKILDYSYVYRKSSIDKESYQRTLDLKRVIKISKLLESGELNSFPNSILLNCLDDLSTILHKPEDCPKEIDLQLPSNFSSCRVVDGQHRLLSFSKVNDAIRQKFSLPIVLFAKMPIKQEIKTFIDINDNQQSINKNLTLSLKAQLDWYKGSKENLEKIAFKVVEFLLEINPSFKNRVYTGKINENTRNKITLIAFINSLIKYKLVTKNGSILQNNNEENFQDIGNILNDFYQNLISKDGKNQSYYYSNRGIQLIIRYIGVISLNINKGYLNENFDFYKSVFIKSIPQLINKIKDNQGVAGENKTFKTVTEYLFQQEKISIITDLNKLK